MVLFKVVVYKETLTLLPQNSGMLLQPVLEVSLRVKLMSFLGGGWNSLKINGFGISANKK